MPYVKSCFSAPTLAAMRKKCQPWHQEDGVALLCCLLVDQTFVDYSSVQTRRCTMSDRTIMNIEGEQKREWTKRSFCCCQSITNNGESCWRSSFLFCDCFVCCTFLLIIDPQEKATIWFEIRFGKNKCNLKKDKKDRSWWVLIMGSFCRHVLLLSE